MTNRTAYKSCLLILCLVMVACESETDSENIKTAGIHADIRAIASGDTNTSVSAHLTVGSGGTFSTNIELTGGDSLTATTDSVTTIMVKEKDWFTGRIYYRATLPGDSAGTLITVALNRPNDIDAPDSNVALPTAPLLSAPNADQSFSQAADITVVWDNNGTTLPVNLEFDFSCSLSNSNSGFSVTKANIANIGTITYPVASLLGNLVLKSGESCNTIITISREITGNLDQHFGEGGSVTAIQYRKVAVKITP